MSEEPEVIETTTEITTEIEESPAWDRGVKTLVAVSTLVLVVAIAARFTDLILRIIAAGIIAYVLTPVINFIAERSPLSRGASIAVTYLLVVALLVGFGVLLGVSTFQQVTNLIDTIPTLVDEVANRITSTDVIRVGPLEFDVAALWGAIDWAALEDQIIATVVPALNQGGRTVVAIVGSTVEVITVIFFTAVISVYLAFEAGRLGSRISSAVYEPAYRRDAERIIREFDRIWQAYLRGQIVLAVIIFLAVWLSLSFLGVQNAFGLGVLSGLLEFLPVIGPVVGTIVAAAVAFLQPTNYLGLEPWLFALLVIGVMFLIQQIENNVLVPRIVGRALDLHPLVIIIGVFMGASLAGLIGAILAAPVLATIKLLGTYAWRKMFDLQPFPEPEQELRDPSKVLVEQPLSLLDRLRRKKPSKE
ncbi:MAG TPA: AI-2E family transporter [Anaerolineae bacterium]|jgi:predicted PurR-regulated permease PerM|nr:AI-2E family transporter [Anaerolineae bacterium]